MDLRREFPKAALRVSLAAAFGKAALFGSIGLIASRNHLTPTNVSFGVVVALGLALFTEYFWFYLPNIRRHELMLDRLGSDYEDELHRQIEAHGVGSLLQRWWFLKRWRQARDEGRL